MAASVVPTPHAGYSREAAPCTLPEVAIPASGFCSSKVVSLKDSDQLVYDPGKRTFNVFKASCWRCDCCCSGKKERARNSAAWNATHQAIVQTAGQQIATYVYNKTKIQPVENADDGVMLTHGEYAQLRREVHEATKLLPVAVKCCKAMRFMTFFSEVKVTEERVELDLAPEDCISPRGRGAISVMPPTAEATPSNVLISGDGVHRIVITSVEDSAEEPDIVVVGGRDPTDATGPYETSKIVKTLRGFSYRGPTIREENALLIAEQVKQDLIKEHIFSIKRENLTKRIIVVLKMHGYRLNPPTHWRDWDTTLRTMSKKGIMAMSPDEFSTVMQIAKEFATGERHWSVRGMTEKGGPPLTDGSSSSPFVGESAREGTVKGGGMRNYDAFNLTLRTMKAPTQQRMLGNLFDKPEEDAVMGDRKEGDHPLAMTGSPLSLLSSAV